jgi:hypothetical protein
MSEKTNPGAAGAAPGARNSSSRKPTNNQVPAATQAPVTSPALQSIYNGRRCIGFLLLRGRRGVEALDSNTTSLGLFPTQKAAADAIFARGAAS